MSAATRNTAKNGIPDQTDGIYTLFQTKTAKSIPYFRLEMLENGTLWGGTYLYVGVRHCVALVSLFHARVASRNLPLSGPCIPARVGSWSLVEKGWRTPTTLTPALDLTLSQALLRFFCGCTNQIVLSNFRLSPWKYKRLQTTFRPSEPTTRQYVARLRKGNRAPLDIGCK